MPGPGIWNMIAWPSKSQTVAIGDRYLRHESKGSFVSRPEQAPLRKRIREIAETRMRYRYRRIHVLLRRDGWHVDGKRVRRLHKLEGLQMELKPPCRRVQVTRRSQRATGPNQVWAMDWMHDEALRWQAAMGSHRRRHVEPSLPVMRLWSGGLKIWMVRFRDCSNQIPRQLARLAVSNRSRPANHLGNR